MDDIDRANDQVDKETEQLINQARKSQPEAAATGACLYCGDEVKPGFRWCCPECRDDWEMVR